ncbi:SDR family NAD(P)-dependent oxidoreductase [Streptoalloteichus hindustanus]|uniref:NAD(P)-dependent dehydrogenase, short-chain alcohol dehydrogenase family n=1 Tax=Streptoalloteichus hindustanus TaxID=2017 RepID=A0A1M4ZHE1_STRHI|nr:SDR family NAD(P)-dependent oxidoreductase [Streptoalloteichus hindustanus]SHF17459.1 NAD(P)-dependent dehydrogenase, short-chain alcohol dehydrogenase family [Streptoalloteichus hindustanus]
MKTIVITGGTDGMGNALARTYLRRGDTVAVIGRDTAKGQAFLDAAEGAGRAFFFQADLSEIEENERIIRRIRELFPVVDALVLCARHFRSTRRETADGFEATFALEYLSRFLFGHGLVEPLRKAAAPVIVNVSGPGMPKPEIRWADPGLRRGYDGVTAQTQAGRANDLLGVAFAAEHAPGPIRYVLVNPGGVATSFSGEYDAETLAHVEMLKRFGKPVHEGIAPITARIDAPPAEPLSAFVEEQRIGLAPNDFDPVAASRLRDLTRALLARRESGNGGLRDGSVL